MTGFNKINFKESRKLTSLNMSLNFRGSFSYKDTSINVIKIRDNVNMRVVRENNQVARIFFVDDQNNTISVPRGLTLKDISDNVNVKPHRHEFLISWVANYEIYLDGEKVISLDNQKQQAIRGIDTFTYSTIENEDSDSDDEDSNSDDEDDEDEDWGQLIRNYNNDIHRIITRGHKTLTIPIRRRRDWIIYSSRRNTRGGTTLLYSNRGNFRVTLSRNIYRFDGFSRYDENEEDNGN